MKAIILVFVAALRLTVVADEPQTLSAVQARAIYEKSITLADTSRAEAVQAAKDDALTELASALDTSLKNKNRKEANVIAAAIKSLTENSVLEAGLLPAIDTIREGYEGRVVSAQKQYTEQISDPRTRYLMALETALDAAFAAKNLEEVNRIDAAMEPLRAEATRVEPAFAGSLPSFENTIGMTFKPLLAGEFTMGRASEADDSIYDSSGDIQRPVRISSSFSIGVHEVTQSQYQTVMGDNPSDFKVKGANKPVENVNWDDAVAFCVALSALQSEREAGRVYRLPTEAEWEYACRAGTTTAYSFGDDAQDLSKYAWFSDNSRKKTYEVGKKLPNGWGLYDMHGNVWEWCEDLVGSSRVLRGGSCDYEAAGCTSAYRSWLVPSYRSDSLGFRLALSSPSGKSPEAAQDK